MTSSRLFFGILLLLAVYKSSASEADDQARLKRMEGRIKQLESMEGRIKKLETSQGMLPKAFILAPLHHAGTLNDSDKCDSIKGF